jgi:hypothetical protein
VEETMTAGQVIATLSVLAQIYGAPAPLMECLSWYESGHDVTAVNGDYIGTLQVGSEFWADMVPLYLADETAPHREYVAAHTREDTLARMIVATWAVAHGSRERWSANRLCWDVGRRE